MPADATNPNGLRPPGLIPEVRPSAAAVTGAIQRAAQSTGASFDYLLATAKVESDLNPNLTMRSTSATGLFQFLEQTWLGVMKTAGGAFGFAHYANAITQTPSGQYEVADPQLREEVMQLRKDPVANAAMGGVFTQQNEAVLASRIGRKPTDGELYVAHFFGPYSGAKVINLAASNPDLSANTLFPAEARANHPIFYDKGGNARTIAGVYSELIRRYQMAKSAALSQPVNNATASTSAWTPEFQPAPMAYAPRDTAGVTSAFAAIAEQAAAQSEAPAVAPITPLAEGSQTTSVFHSLFGTDDRRGPVAPGVAQLWGVEADRRRTEEAQPDSSSRVKSLDLFQDIRPSGRALFKGGR